MKIDSSIFMQGNETVNIEHVLEKPTCPAHVRVQVKSTYDYDKKTLGQDNFTMFFDSVLEWSVFLASMLSADGKMRECD